MTGKLLLFTILVNIVVKVYGQNLNSPASSTAPVGLERLSCGRKTCCKVMDDNVSLKCWGSNEFFQLGIPTSNSAAHFGDQASEVIPNSGGFVMFHNTNPFEYPVLTVSVGDRSTCAIIVKNTVRELYCWGKNDFGQLGLGAAGDRTFVNFTSTKTDARSATGTVVYDPIQVAVGGNHACLLSAFSSTAPASSLRVVCWGSNNLGQLGRGDTQTMWGTTSSQMNNLIPVNLDVPSNGVEVIKITAGLSHTCALIQVKTAPFQRFVKCFGSNSFGQLGINSNVNFVGTSGSSMGTGLPSLALNPSNFGYPTNYIQNFVDITLSPLGDTSCGIVTFLDPAEPALPEPKEAVCWGKNDKGQLAQEDTINYGKSTDPTTALFPMEFDPIIDVGLNEVEKIALGPAHVCAIITTQPFRSLRCFGSTGTFALGLDPVPPVATLIGDTPEDFPPQNANLGQFITNIKAGQIAAGNSHTCVEMNFQEALVCFGANVDGILGSPTFTGARGDATGELGVSLSIANILQLSPPPPTKSPTKSPTAQPTTKSPTKSPTLQPTTRAPTNPTNSPTQNPTTSSPTDPTNSPTLQPTTKAPTEPTKAPTNSPTTKGPTNSPIVGTSSPTEPTKAPTKAPTTSPTKSPSKSPTKSPTKAPTQSPTKAPTKSPTESPTTKPTSSPTTSPTSSPTLLPTTSSPTNQPTTSSPTRRPTPLVCDFSLECEAGTFQKNCDCLPCPAGTFRPFSGEGDLCILCNSPEFYCPEKSASRIPRANGFCTFNDKDQIYYNSYLTLQVFDPLLNSSRFFSDFVSPEVFAQDKIGGLRRIRNNAVACGNVAVISDPFEIQGAEGSIISGRLTLANFDSIPANFSFSTNAAASTTNPKDGVKNKFFLSAGQVDFLSVEVDSNFLEFDVNDEAIFTLTISAFSFWAQSTNDLVLFPSIILPVKVKLGLVSFITTPSGFEVSLQQSSITSTRKLKIVNLLSSSNTIQGLIEFRENADKSQTWVAIRGDNNEISLDGEAESTSVCECLPNGDQDTSFNISTFSTTLVLEFNTEGLESIDYTAILVLTSSADNSRAEIPISLQVSGGLVDLSKTSIDLLNGLQESDIHQDDLLGFEITLRDVVGNPSLDLSNFGLLARDVKFDFTITLSEEEICGDEISSCSYFGEAVFDPQSDTWKIVEQFRLPQKGLYHVQFTSNPEGILDQEVLLNILPLECLGFSEVNEEGNRCSCIDGYGETQRFQFSVDCSPCQPGTRSLNGFCVPCAPGTVQGLSQQSQCEACEGSTQPNLLKTACEECDPGNIQNPETFFCERCPIGMVPSANKTTCEHCPTLLEEPTDDQKSCRACPADAHVPLTPDNLARRCSICSFDRKIRLKSNSETEYECICRPQYYTAEDGSCVPCPIGAFCAYRRFDNLLPLDGYTALTSSNSSVPRFQDCRDLSSKEKKNCQGIVLDSAFVGDDSVTSKALQSFLDLVGGESNVDCPPCGEGFTGVMCFKCTLGYSRTSVSDCTKCLDRNIVLGLVIAGFIIVALLTSYLIYRTINLRGDSDEIIVLRIAASSLQMTAMQQTFGISWPPFLYQMFQVFDMVSSAGQSVFTIDCLIDTSESTSESVCNINQLIEARKFRSFFTTALIIAILPLICLVFAASFWGGRYMWIKFRTGKSRAKSFFNYFLVSNIVVLFLLHPTLTRSGLRFFSCSKESLDGYTFLEADFDIVCWSAEHSIWAFTLGILMLVVYAFGIPISSFAILHRNEKTQSKYKTVFNFIYQGYKPEYYYWEVVVMIRKLLFAFISVVLKPYGTDIQQYAAILVLMIALSMQLNTKPYVKGKFNNADTLGLVTNFMTSFLGLFLASASVPEESPVRFAFSILIVLFNAYFIAYCLYYLFRYTSVQGAEIVLSRIDRTQTLRKWADSFRVRNDSSIGTDPESDGSPRKSRPTPAANISSGVIPFSGKSSQQVGGGFGEVKIASPTSSSSFEEQRGSTGASLHEIPVSHIPEHVKWHEDKLSSSSGSTPMKKKISPE